VRPAFCGGGAGGAAGPPPRAHPPPPPRDRVARQHAEVSDEIDRVTSANDLAAIDVAGEAFLKNRARTMFRVHPKLRCDGEAAQLFDDLLAELKRQEADLGVGKWRDRVNKLLGETGTANDSQLTDGDDSLVVRLSNSKKGQIVRYHDGLAWITERHEQLTQGILPLPSFGDDSDTLSLTGKISLKQHLADVYHEATRFVTGLTLNEVLSSTVLQAARLHDVGKADPRFQAVLLNKPLSVAYMQRQLWAKSDGTGRNTISELPDNFRHEMLSLALFDRFELDEPIDQDLLMHNIASHHGHARPFAPVCIDDAPVSLNLSGLGLDNISSEQRASWRPAHQLDSGIADRFWKMNRKYGWWGLAYLESLLRLADWFASGTPGRGDDAGISLTGIPAGCNGMWDSEVALRLPPA
jgi:CRISPR-associated endonuclease/helicase Cas3